MIKCSGIEWARFYTDPVAWPEHAWHEDAYVTVNGVETDDDYDPSTVPAT